VGDFEVAIQIVEYPEFPGSCNDDASYPFDINGIIPLFTFKNPRYTK
jgi:hypothetical protein